MARNAKVGALLAKSETAFDKAQAFLRTKDEDAENAGEPIVARLLRKAAKSFGTNVVFAADRHGVENTLERILRAYMIIDPREAHTLATWYAVKSAEAGDEGMTALVKAARLVTTNPQKQAWALLGDEDNGIERRGDAAVRLLREVVRINRTNALIADEANRLRVAADAKMNEVAFLLIDAGLFGGKKLDVGSNPEAEAIAADIIDAGLKVEAPTPKEEDGVPVEGAAQANPETGTESDTTGTPAETGEPKKLTAKERRAAAKEAVKAAKPAAALTGVKPATPRSGRKVVEGGLAGLGDLGLGGDSTTQA